MSLEKFYELHGEGIKSVSRELELIKLSDPEIGKMIKLYVSPEEGIIAVASPLILSNHGILNLSEIPANVKAEIETDFSPAESEAIASQIAKMKAGGYITKAEIKPIAVQEPDRAPTGPDEVKIRTDDRNRTFVTINDEMVCRAKYVSFKANTDDFNQTIIHLAASKTEMKLKSNNITIVQASVANIDKLQTIHTSFKNETNQDTALKLLEELIEEMK